MIKDTQPQRKLLGIQNGLKIFSRLKTETRLKIITPKQQRKNDSWRTITEQKIAEVQGVCQWCGLPGKRHSEFDFLSGHHIIKRRFNINTIDNCYVCHYRSCHMYIENNSIDVRLYPTKLAWENR